MTRVSHANLAIARRFPWSKYRIAMDVGTVQGDLITQVALANPHIEGIGFDLAGVGPIFDEFVEGNFRDESNLLRAASWTSTAEG